MSDLHHIPWTSWLRAIHCMVAIVVMGASVLCQQRPQLPGSERMKPERIMPSFVFLDSILPVSFASSLRSDSVAATP
ncbi:hypothetical protein QBC33DRAFT_15854 [Phialemonium atrogriseum]|uniref:Uncharacterized protein n=1 Tax=Phialemonium atrogriseum TaxID=1093897 RepID=A0AAJ0CDY2_9PEZI|nr:uncharacterized protein QBC33DRAFT_15854 [Phialemonium atrogriseum]KAK1772551.1 hypothetical protein QBC33DRAFT_15854 [Phialemonium atrogriseum]